MRLRIARPSGFTALAFLLAASSAAHVLLRTSTYGAAIGPDAVSYMSAAANLIDGHGLQDFRGTSLFAWPPLFPLSVAAVGAWGVGPLEAGRLLNATAYGLTILVSVLWLGRTLGSSWLAAGVAVMLATFYPLSHEASFLQSEPTFILFTLLALLKLEECQRPGAGRRALALAAAFSSMAALTRFAGVALVLTGVLLLLLRPAASRSSPAPSMRALTGRAAVYGAASILPLAVWSARNWMLFGDWKLTGSHSRAYSLGELLGQLLQAPARAVTFGELPDWAAYLLLAGVAMVVCVAAWTCVRTTRRSESAALAGIRPALPFAAFGALYIVFLLCTVSRFAGQDMNHRFLLVAYVPCLLAGACLLDDVLRLDAGGRLSWVRRTTAALAVAGCVFSVVLAVRHGARVTMKSLDVGFHARTYNSAYWQESETIRFLKANPAAHEVRANRFGVLHAVLALQTGADVRGKYPTLPRRQADLAALADVSDTGFDIVWLRFDGEDGFDYDNRTLASMPGLTLVADLADGVVFRAHGRSGSR